jgi:glycerol-1-phosphate dehydrogenase [NAD(P)+]
MTVDGVFANVDVTHLDDLRRSLREADPDERLAPIGMRRLEIGTDALDRLPSVVSDVGTDGSVVVVSDDAPILRDGSDVKSQILDRLRAFSPVHVVVGRNGEPVNADERTIAQVGSSVSAAGCVVAVGGGTITDICKEATRPGSIPLVVVQTAASVNAFSNNMAVTLLSGVKRTVPSRWPDALVVDLTTLASAPRAMTIAGFGDLLELWTAPADWYLAASLGMDDTYHPAVVAMLDQQRDAFLAAARAVGNGDVAGLDQLARLLTLTGFALGIVGTTAPLSGSEHMVSHLIDMAANADGRPHALHGAQVAVACVAAAAAWDLFLAEFSPSSVDLDRCFPAPASLEERVRSAFERVDPSGAAGQECWADLRPMVERWDGSRSTVESFLRDWDRHREALSALTGSPEHVAGALRDLGSATRFGELDPPVDAEIARWSLRNCHLVRRRFTLPDLLFLIGRWDESFVERVLARSTSAGGGL